MRKVIAGIAALAVVSGGAAAVVYAPSDDKPSVNSIAAAAPAGTGDVDVFVALGTLAGEKELPVDSNGLPTDQRLLGQPGAPYHQLSGYSTSQENTTALSTTSTGLLAGKASFNPLELDLPLSQAYPRLVSTMATGKYSPFVRLYFRKTNTTTSTPTIYMALTLKMVFIKKVELPLPDGGSPYAHVSLEYGSYVVTYFPTDPKGGTSLTPIHDGWNRIKNVTDTSPTAALQ